MYVTPTIWVILFVLLFLVFFGESLIRLFINIREELKKRRQEPSECGYMSRSWRPRWIK